MRRCIYNTSGVIMSQQDLILEVREVIQRYHGASANQIAKKLHLDIATVERVLKLIKSH